MLLNILSDLNGARQISRNEKMYFDGYDFSDYIRDLIVKYDNGKDGVSFTDFKDAEQCEAVALYIHEEDPYLDILRNTDDNLFEDIKNSLVNLLFWPSKQNEAVEIIKQKLCDCYRKQIDNYINDNAGYILSNNAEYRSISDYEYC